MTDASLVWLRRDLRIDDNPALFGGLSHQHCYPIYIFDERTEFKGASGLWLYHSLIALNESLNNKLSIYIGKPEELVPKIAARLGANTLYANHVYEPQALNIEQRVISALNNAIQTNFGNGTHLIEPNRLLKEDGTVYKVFTPFYNNLIKNHVPPLPRDTPIPLLKKLELDSESTQTTSALRLLLLTDRPWEAKLIAHWHIGEQGAIDVLNTFLTHGINHYAEGRDFPAQPAISTLSPYLHFGSISPIRLWHRVLQSGMSDNQQAFLRQLIWREFSTQTLLANPNMAQVNLRSQFDDFAWHENPDYFKRWRLGQTGFPIIDAGMRQLRLEGFMHNRVRMLVASFLTKNLLIDWRLGRKWFEDNLVDADLANNSASWQWVAGTGIDAAPYFRIFNPITQAEKFDKNGDYIRHYVAELRDFPSEFIHTPWKDELMRHAARYPAPMVDLATTRQRALDEYQRIRQT